MFAWQSTLKKRPSLFPTIVGFLSLLFILLINFMIANSVVFWSGVEAETSLTLPTIRNAGVSVADKLIITITRNEELFFNDKQMGWEDLEQSLREIVRESKIGTAHVLDEKKAKSDSVNQDTVAKITPMIILRADVRTPFQTISRLTDICRGEGLRVYLAAEEEKNLSNIIGQDN